MEIITLKMESKTDRQERITDWSQQILREARALVVGAGAIGNELLKNLALMGFGYVLICDMDHIGISNLSRTVLFGEKDLGELKSVVAARRYVELNVEETARADSFVGNVCHQLGAGVLNHVDVVIGCLDNLQARFEINRRCNLVGKPFIDAGIADFTANVTAVFTGGGEDRPCWACQQSAREAEAAKAMVRTSCEIMRRDAAAKGHVPTTQVASAIAAGLQSQEVVKCLHAVKGGSMQWDSGVMYLFNGRYNTFDRFRMARRADCDDHYRYPAVIAAPIGSDWTLGRTLQYVRDSYGPGYFLNTERDGTYRLAAFLTEAKCRCCGRTIVLNRSANQVVEDDFYCPDCPHDANLPAESWKGARYVFALEDSGDLLDFTLEQLGIPPLHILEFENEDPEKETLALEMTADLDRIMPSLAK